MAGFSIPLLIAAALALAPASASVPSAAGRLPPVDQCLADESFVAFRDELGRTIARRDREALLGALANDVLVDFGGGTGRAEFARIWFADERSQDALWAKLKQILSLGCVAWGEDYVAPSLIAQFDDQLDATSVVIAGAGTALRSEPKEGAPAVARLDWEMLTVASFEQSWLPVSLADGRRGFVRADQVHSPMDYRLTFKRVGGRWRITSFVAGD